MLRNPLWEEDGDASLDLPVRKKWTRVVRCSRAMAFFSLRELTDVFALPGAVAQPFLYLRRQGTEVFVFFEQFVVVFLLRGWLGVRAGLYKRNGQTRTT